MAIPTNALGAYTGIGVGIREDLLDFVTNIDPEETPFFSLAPKSVATSVKHEWLEDSHSAESIVGAVDGDDWSGDAILTPTRHTNPCQIIRRDFGISGSSEKSDSVQGQTGAAYQMTKKLSELARDTEKTLFQGSIGVAGTPYGNATLGRTLKGLIDWAEGTGGNSTAFDTAGGTAAAQEADFNEMLEEIWGQGVRADTCIVNSVLKKAISGFTTTTRIHHDGGPSSPNVISKSIEMYDSDFGSVDVLLGRYCTAANPGIAYKRDMMRVAIFRPTQVERLAKSGDSEKYMALHELTLEVLSPGALGTWLDG